jgi:hypothetical protein
MAGAKTLEEALNEIERLKCVSLSALVSVIFVKIRLSLQIGSLRRRPMPGVAR